MRLIMGCIVFNDIEFIQDHIRYHYPLFDKLIYIDGAYEDFPHESPLGWSNDGTLEVLTHYKQFHDPENKMLVLNRSTPWHTEMQKRSVYLQYGLPGDWVFVVDSDMFIWGDMRRLREFLPFVPERFNVLSPALIDYRDTNGSMVQAYLCGLIRCIPGVIYYKNHWTLLFPGDKIHLGGPWFTESKEWDNIHLPWMGWKHFERSDKQRATIKQPYYSMHHMIEEIEPWKWTIEDWNLLDLVNICVNDAQRRELVGRKEGLEATKKQLEDLEWNV